MSRPSWTLSLVLGLATVASLTYAWRLHAQLATAQAELAARRQDLTRLQQTAEALQPPPSPAGAPLFPPSTANPAPAPAMEGPAGAPPRPFPNSGMAAMRDSPEMQHLMGIQRRAALDGRYAALFRKLNLSPADLEKLKSLLVEKQSAATDVFAAMRAEGLNPRESRDQMGQLIAKFEAESDATIRSTLGESVFQQYQQYEQTMPQRSVANQLEQRLSYSSTPLNGYQTEQLVNVLAASAPANGGARPTPIPGANGPFGPGRNVPITDAVIAQTQGFLSASQVDALRELQQEQAAQAQLRQQMQQARRNGGSPTQPTTPGGSGP